MGQVQAEGPSVAASKQVAMARGAMDTIRLGDKGPHIQAPSDMPDA